MITSGQLAIIRRLVDNSNGYTVVWPDHDGSVTHTMPRFVAELAGGGASVLDLNGRVDSTPQVVVKVETEEGDFAKDSVIMQGILATLFKPGSVFSGVSIDVPIVARAPLEGTGTFIVPVIIRGRYIY